MKQLDPKAVWLFFISFILRWFVVVIILSVWGSTFLGFSGALDDGVFSFSFSKWLAGVILILLVLSFIWAKLTYHFYRYEFTDLGFKKEHGVILKKYVTIPYDRIQNVDIFRGVFARLLGLSDLQIQTAGGITAGSYGAFAEGRLPGISKTEAEYLRDELLKRAKTSRGQGL